LKTTGFTPWVQQLMKFFFVFHPGAKITFGHQDHDDFVDIVPGPIAFEFFGLFGQEINGEFIANFEEQTRSFADVWPAVLCF